MSFIALTDGKNIKADQITSYTKFRHGEVRFVMSNGDTVTGTPCYEDFDEVLAKVIPAASGFYQLIGTPDEDGDRHWTRLPIIAWKINPGGVYPIVAGPDTEREDVGILYPDGHVLDHDENMYASFSEFVAVVTAEDDLLRLDQDKAA